MISDLFTVVVCIALWREVRIAENGHIKPTGSSPHADLLKPDCCEERISDGLSIADESERCLRRRVEAIPFERLSLVIRDLDDPVFDKLEAEHRQRVRECKARILRALPAMRQSNEAGDSGLSLLQDIVRKNAEDPFE